MAVSRVVGADSVQQRRTWDKEAFEKAAKERMQMMEAEESESFDHAVGNMA